jgi:hypothetical protein
MATVITGIKTATEEKKSVSEDKKNIVQETGRLREDHTGFNAVRWAENKGNAGSTAGTYEREDRGDRRSHRDEFRESRGPESKGR